jgi:hypothetical protein
MVAAQRFLSVLAHTAERLDFAPSGVIEDQIQNPHRSVALDRFESGRLGLCEDQCLLHCLSTCCEIDEQRITTARAVRFGYGPIILSATPT